MEALVATSYQSCYASGRIIPPVRVAYGAGGDKPAFSTIFLPNVTPAVGLSHPLCPRSKIKNLSQGAGLIYSSSRPKFLIQSAAPPAERSTKDETFEDQRMAAGPLISLSGGSLEAGGKAILTEVPDNVSIIPDEGSPDVGGAFLGAAAVNADSSHTFRLGILSERRFLALFRFKLWWMTQKVGASASDIPAETQFLLLEVETDAPSGPQGHGSNIKYIVLLPLLDGAFRSSFEGSSDGHLLLHCQSGDSEVQSGSSPHAVYILAGDNPYQIISDAVRAVEKHTNSFVRREKKQLPASLDCFGWCTWDAYYTAVNVDGVHRGLASLAAGGTPPRFLIIDDGWQSTGEDGKEVAMVSVGTQYASRLMDFRENKKFKQLKGAVTGAAMVGLAEVVQELKATHHLSHVYVWHALLGYWGGVQPSRQTGAGQLDRFQSTLVFPIHSAGVLLNQPNMAEDSLTVTGVGVVPPSEIAAFYDTMHSYLAEAGVDGMKVDAQSILETVGGGYGGRVQLAKVYHEALEKSVAKNFPDNGVIACMSHHTDGLYSAKQTAVIRASDDFWPRDPASHSVHVASVAYNSLFLGEFMQPDWDMFQSRHPAADYHAAARAVGGCAVYVSDKPGEHDFEVLKNMVLPDGSVLRALLPGRPTRDSLFEDPCRDTKSMLKIWNMNRHTGLLGAFNCQGATWCRVERKYVIHDDSPPPVTASIRALDVDSLLQLAGPDWTGDAALFAFRSQELKVLTRGFELLLTLERLQYELFTITPIQSIGFGVAFAPIGLVNMYNCGGSIISVEYNSRVQKATATGSVGKEQGDSDGSSEVVVSVRNRGFGYFGAYSSRTPWECRVNGIVTEIHYDGCRQMMKICIPEDVNLFASLQIIFKGNGGE